MKYAFLDLGTNTFNLLVTEKTENGIRILHSGRIPARLGKGGMKTMTITPDAFERGIQAIKEHQKTALQFGEMQFHAFATSMIRDASNGDAFAEQVYRETGIRIQVVSGDREAELIFKGVNLAFSSEKPFLIMDIGGGSTEFIIAKKGELIWKKSYKLGVTRLYESFQKNDPISSTEIQNTESHLKENLNDLFIAIKKEQPHTLIGSAGSFESYAEIIARRTQKNGIDLSIPSHPIDPEHLTSLLEEIIQSTHTERKKIEGLHEIRRDLIVMASILLRFVLKHSEFKQLRFSVYALKEGLMAEVTEA